jgi:D-beta-D-heptose 7-phosphate kinase/D-beta-D-heptose 1-phosphate adenosyltransferase
LQFAKKQGDILVVGLNTDESIKRFKGDSRPINNIEERCELLKNLGFIDYIIIFKDDTPEKILSLLKPNVLIKGGDYTKESIIGKEFADKIIIYNYIDGLSSTNVIKKIKNI